MIQNIFIAVIIALVVALGLVTFDRYRTVIKLEAAQKTLGIQRGAIQSLQNDLSVREDVIIKQNKALDNLSTEEKLKTDKIAKALEEAKKESIKNKKKANDLLLEKRKSDNACKDSEDLINNYLGFK